MNPIDLLVVRSIKMGEMGEMGELLATFTGYSPGSLRIADVSRIVVYIEGINRNIITDTVIQQFISLGITQVKHLCEMKSYEPQFWSKRIFESLKHEITATSLPQHWNDVSHKSSRWETDSVIKHVTDIEISCEKSKLVGLRNPPKKGLYRIAFDYWFSYDDDDPRVWCDILRLIESILQ